MAEDRPPQTNRTSVLGSAAPMVQCRATSKQKKVQCKRPAIPGGTVCRFHGGAAPQVKAKAEMRLRMMVAPMIERLNELAMQSDHLPTAAKAVIDALDRAGIGEMAEAKIRLSKTKEPPAASMVVNIGFLTPRAERPALPEVTEDAEVIEDETHD